MTYSEALRIKPFRDLWLGQSISQVGDAIYYSAFMFMVKKVTGSSAMVGYTGAMEALPFLFFGAQAGVLADRIDRRIIMLLSDLACTVALAIFALAIFFSPAPPAWSLLFLAFALSSIRCFFMPAKSAAIPALVPAETLMTANSLSMTTQTFVPMIGLAIAASVMGLLYAFSPRFFFVGTVSVNALSFLASAYFIARLPKIVPVRKDAHETHPLSDFREGIRYVARRHDLKALIAMIATFRFAVSPFFVAYVVANDLWWGGSSHHGKPQTLAAIELTFFLGMVIASFQMRKVKATHPVRWFCLGLTLVGFTVAMMAFSSQIWVFCIWNFLAGLAVPMADLPINTYFQLSVEDGFRGRTNSVLNMIASIAPPIGMALGGAFVAGYGLVNTFLVMGVGMVVTGLYGLVDKPLRDVVMPKHG